MLAFLIVAQRKLTYLLIKCIHSHDGYLLSTYLFSLHWVILWAHIDKIVRSLPSERYREMKINCC